MATHRGWPLLFPSECVPNVYRGRNHPPFRRRPDHRQRRLATRRQASRSLVKMAPMAFQTGATGSRCAAQRPRPGGGSRSGAWAFPTCSPRFRSPQGEVSAASLGGPQTTNSIDLDSGYHGARVRKVRLAPGDPATDVGYAAWG